MPRIKHYHQKFLGGKKVQIGKAKVLYACPIFPQTAWSSGSFTLSYQSETIEMDKAGMVDIQGIIIPQAFTIDERLDLTPAQIFDKFGNVLDKLDFGSGISDNERVSLLTETKTEDNPEGRDEGDDDVQEDKIVRHPAIFDQVEWLGLGPKKFMDYNMVVGAPFGRYQAIDANTVRYNFAFNKNFSMMGSGDPNSVGCVLIVASIPTLKPDRSNPTGQEDEKMSPWANYPIAREMFETAETEFTKLLLTRSIGSFKETFRELLAWKTLYNVEDDTWENKDGKFWLRASNTLTTFFDEERTHF